MKYQLRLGVTITTAALAFGAAAIGALADSASPLEVSTTGVQVVHLATTGSESKGLAINDRSEVGGYDRTSQNHAVIWDANGNERMLSAPPLSVNDEVHGINNLGIAVGVGSFRGLFVGQPAIFPRAIKWDSAGRPFVLQPLPNGTIWSANAVNDTGLAVGTSNGPGPKVGNHHAVRWDSAGAPTDLGTLPGGTTSDGLAINRSGEVAGSSNTPLATHAVYWDRGGNIVDLDPLGTGRSVATGINDAGQIVGSANLGGNTHAVLWDKQGGVIDLGTLPGATTSVANGINELGEVTGHSDTVDFNQHAVFWNRQHNIVDLGTAPGDYDFSDGLAVNDRGQVAGTGNLVQGFFLVPRAVRWDTRATPNATTTTTAPATTTTTAPATTTTAPATTTTTRPAVTTTTVANHSCAQSVNAARQRFNSAIDSQERGQSARAVGAMEQARVQQNAAFDQQLAAC